MRMENISASHNYSRKEILYLFVPKRVGGIISMENKNKQKGHFPIEGWTYFWDENIVKEILSHFGM